MATAKEGKALTVRLQAELYEAATQVARKQHTSLNALVQRGLEEVIKVADDREMYEAATLLSEDADACDVSNAFSAQAEVALRDGS